MKDENISEWNKQLDAIPEFKRLNHKCKEYFYHYLKTQYDEEYHLTSKEKIEFLDQFRELFPNIPTYIIIMTLQSIRRSNALIILKFFKSIDRSYSIIKKRNLHKSEVFNYIPNNIFKSICCNKDGDIKLFDFLFKLYVLLNNNEKIFHCAHHIANMLGITSNKIYQRKTPFNSLFIDATIKVNDDIELFGIKILCSPIDGSLICNAYGIDKSKKMIWENDKIGYYVVINKEGIDDRSESEKATRNDKQIIKFIANFVCNWLDFLNDPRVEYVNAPKATGRSAKKQRWLYDVCGIDINKTYLVKIEPLLRIHIDKSQHIGKHHGYSHKFWVRGHWRTLRHEKYKVNIGKKIWILPHTKGEGILINKEYYTDDKGTSIKD